MRDNNNLKLKKFIRILISFIVFILLILYFLIINKTIADTTKIDLASSDSSCANEKYCFVIDTIYNDGWARWKLPIINVALLSFTANDKTYVNEDHLSLVCPIKYSLEENKLLVKIKFLLGQSNISKCKTTKST